MGSNWRFFLFHGLWNVEFSGLGCSVLSGTSKNWYSTLFCRCCAAYNRMCDDVDLWPTLQECLSSKRSAWNHAEVQCPLRDTTLYDSVPILLLFTILSFFPYVSVSLCPSWQGTSSSLLSSLSFSLSPFSVSLSLLYFSFLSISFKSPNYVKLAETTALTTTYFTIDAPRQQAR